MPPLPCHELRGFGKSSQLSFSTSDPTGNFPPSLTSAFHSPGPGGTRWSEKRLSGTNQTIPIWHAHAFTAHRKSGYFPSIPALLTSQWTHVAQKPSKCKMLVSTWQGPPRSWLTPRWVQCWGEGQNVLPCTMEWHFPHKRSCLICQSLTYFYSLRASSSQCQMLPKQIFLYELHRTSICMAQEMKP